MNDEISPENLLRQINEGWDALHACLGTLTNEQLTVMTDAAGWTVKDHMIHLALWEDSLLALLDGQDRPDAMNVPQSVWAQGSDAVNAVTQQRHHDLPLAEVKRVMADTHARVLAKIGSMTTEDLLRPYKQYQPASDRELPVVQWMIGNTYGHYEQHLPWIQAIAEGRGQQNMTVTELLEKIEHGWNGLQVYLAGLNAAQLTGQTDAAGWTVKDHVIHMAMWEYGCIALLDGADRLAAMGIGDASWDLNTDALNAVLQKRWRDLPWSEVIARFRETHAQVVARYARLSDDDLLRPYTDFQPDGESQNPVIRWLAGDSYEHYEEHLPWMRAIVEGRGPQRVKVAALLDNVARGWNYMQTWLAGLSDEQFTQKTDAAGWTVKDHAMHLSKWEDSLLALLDGKSRAEGLGVSEEMWDAAMKAPDFTGWDAVNGEVRQRYHDLPRDDVMRALRESHARVVAKVGALTDADLARPYKYFQPSSDRTEPVIDRIEGNTFEHYDEHMVWMKAIAESEIN